MSLLLSVLALVATFYQLYLQRLHNEKSLKPLGQLVLEDQRKTLAVHLRNNGLGPLIIDKITYCKDGVIYDSLAVCLSLPPRSYLYAPANDSVKRVLLQNASLSVFETHFDEHDDHKLIEQAREQLAPIAVNVQFRDIYDNQMTIERDFQWFARHDSNQELSTSML